MCIDEKMKWLRFYVDIDYFYYNRKVEIFNVSRYKCRVFYDLK